MYHVGANAQRWVTTGPYNTILPNRLYKIGLYTNGNCMEDQYSFYYAYSGLRAQYSFNNSTWYDLSWYGLLRGYNHVYQSDAVWGGGQLGAGVWMYKEKAFWSGPSDTQVWFRYGFESDPYWCEFLSATQPNHGGPAIDDIMMWLLPPPKPPVWTEDFESDTLTGPLGKWIANSAPPGVTMLTNSGAAGGGGPAPSGAQAGVYYCMTTPRPYPGSPGYCYFTLATPISISANTPYNLSFYTGGDSEQGGDGLLVGYSFVSGSGPWTWVGPSIFWGYSGAICTGYSGVCALGGVKWIYQTAPLISYPGQTSLWLRIGFSEDTMFSASGPTLDSMALGLQ
jgi:hypothetical protein